MSSFANLERRTSNLEAREPDAKYGALILYAPALRSEAEAIADHEAQYGPIVGEPLFIKLTGVKPG